MGCVRSLRRKDRRMIFNVYCFNCESKYEQIKHPKPGQCGACGSTRISVLEEDRRENRVARSGYDCCSCGCKYYEGDRCIDCNTHVTQIPVCPGVGCDERNAGNPCWEHEKD